MLYLALNTTMNNIPKHILKNSTIEPYNDINFVGKLDFSHGRVKGVAEYCMKLFIDAPSPHFMSTFIYFYLKNPQQENPVTCCAFGPTLTVHPGQGRIIAAYLRGDAGIDSLLIPLNSTEEEIDFLHEVADDVKINNNIIYSYKNQNHTGISTKHFENYFYPTDIRLSYEAEKQELLDQHLVSFYPIEFMFNDRESIMVGQDKANKQQTTQIFCKNPQGLFEFIAYCADGKFRKSENYKILKI
jgi:hypothetical protein